MSTANPIAEAIEIVGLQPLAAACKVSYQAVRKWEKAGRLPRTEWTGETNYSSIIENLTSQKITKAALLSLQVA